MIDTLYEAVLGDFKRYEASKDLLLLISIGHRIPMGIYVLNADKTSHIDYDLIRRPRTELYIMWVNKLLEAGYTVDYDPDDPKNLCLSEVERKMLFNHPSSGKLDDEQYDENCDRLFMHHFYGRVMELFGCYYKVSFSKHGRRRAELEQMIMDWCEINVSDNNRVEDLLLMFRREVRHNRCTYYRKYSYFSWVLFSWNWD